MAFSLPYDCLLFLFAYYVRFIAKMRPVVQLYLIACLAFSAICYSAWKVAGDNAPKFLSQINDEINEHLLGSHKGLELVVFGGSWSDSSIYEYRPAKSQAPTKTWTEHICAQVRTPAKRAMAKSLTTLQISCTHKTFAQPKVIADIGQPGALVDNGLHRNKNFSLTPEEGEPTDLKAQIKEWNGEKDLETKQVSDSQGPTSSNETMFVFDFGLFDIWQAAVIEPSNGEYIVKASIDIIFQALDYLDNIKQERTTVKAILPLVIDITFLPAYPKGIEVTKHTHAFLKLWNDQLTEQAEAWEKGDLYLYDTNNFMIDSIRDRQMKAVNHEARDAKPVSVEQQPAFVDVSTTCLGPAPGDTVADATGNVVCQSPDDYLFW